jgi:asparaginyl-tRNA synthetase
MENFAAVNDCGIGSSFKAKGTLIKSPAAGQKYELKVDDPTIHEITILGGTDKENYPLAKSRPKLETLREICHLRVRTNLISAITRIRNNLAFSTHEFFQ